MKLGDMDRNKVNYQIVPASLPVLPIIAELKLRKARLGSKEFHKSLIH